MRSNPWLVQVDITFLTTLNGTDLSARIVTSLELATVFVLSPTILSLSSDSRTPIAATS